MSGVRTASGLKSIVRMQVRDAGNALRAVARVRVRDGSNVLRNLAGTAGGSMTALATPNYVNGYGYSYAPIQVTTDPASVAVTGGTPPYTYVWAIFGDFSPVTPTAPVTSFRSNPMPPGDSRDATAFCDVTDANGLVATSNIINVHAENAGQP